MPIPDHEYMVATPGLEVGEEGGGRAIQKVDALALDTQAKWQISADVDVHLNARKLQDASSSKASICVVAS